MTRARWAALLVLLVLIGLAVQGGEYSTGDWRQLQREVAGERALVDSLTRTVVRLKQREKAVETDPAEQERIAREQWGYVRPGEVLYRVVRPGEK